MINQRVTTPRGWGQFVVPVISLGMVVLIFGGIVGISSIQLRKDLRGKIVQRYADIWGPISKFHIAQGMDDEFLGSLDYKDTIVFSLLAAQEIEGALGIQVFDKKGRFLEGFPLSLDESDLDLTLLKRLEEGTPWGSYRESLTIQESQPESHPEIELNIPIFDSHGESVDFLVRYFMEGTALQEEFNTVDKKLAGQALLAFVSGTLLVSAVFVWSFWRLRKSHAEVEERASRLSRANAELALVAKTSAIGAVASHLIHGLKNPLAGISEHLAMAGDERDVEDLEDAKAATGRMQSLINEVVDVLQNEEFDEMETLTGNEMVRYLNAKFETKAREKELDVYFGAEGDTALSARDANIAKLILSNLIDNAIDAVPVGGEVQARIGNCDSGVVFRIMDTGPGFSKTARASIFSPVQSSKESGAGIGLAISKQLARHLGAELELVRSSSSGTEIRLVIPVKQELKTNLV